MSLLYKHWPPPPKMSRPEYLRYRVRLLVFVISWLAGISAGVYYWHQMPMLVRGFVIALGYVVTPDIGIIEQLFVSFARYAKEGLW